MLYLINLSKKPVFIILCLTLAAAGVLFMAFSVNTETEASEKNFHTHYSIHQVPIPESVTFAGESMPLENFDTFESFERELLVNTYWQSQTLIYLKKAHRYFPVIEEILTAEGVPTDFKYLAVAESGLTNVTSPAGATGFWQFLKGTAIDYKLEVNEEVDERYHLEKSTRAAAAFLKESYALYGSWTMAAASYNMGRKNITKQIYRQKSNNYYDLMLGDETGRYVFRIAALKTVMENPEKYGFFLETNDLYQPLKYKTVTIDSAITSLPDFANKMGINYKVLKELNPWLRDAVLTNVKHKSYQINILTSKKLRRITPSQMFFTIDTTMVDSMLEE